MNPNEAFKKTKYPAAGIYMKYMCTNDACGELLDLHVNDVLHDKVCVGCGGHSWIFVRYNVKHKEE